MVSLEEVVPAHPFHFEALLNVLQWRREVENMEKIMRLEKEPPESE